MIKNLEKGDVSMDPMSIAAMSIDKAQSNVQLQASVAVTKKAMNFQETQVAELMEMLPQQPSFGHKLDIYV